LYSGKHELRRVPGNLFPVEDPPFGGIKTERF
jgi:hypothetical protein